MSLFLFSFLSPFFYFLLKASLDGESWVSGILVESVVVWVITELCHVILLRFYRGGWYVAIDEVLLVATKVIMFSF